MTDPTPQLDRLIDRLSRLIGESTAALQRSTDPGVVDDWYDEIARQLRRYTLAAYMNGVGSTAAPGKAAQEIIGKYIETQLEFLGLFRDEIKASSEWSNAWGPRAQMYAGSIKAPWWSGKTKGYPLPAMPGDGTTICLTHCGCAWELDELEGDGNADAYWRRAKDDSCQSCLEREAQWAPLRIRDGELL